MKDDLLWFTLGTDGYLEINIRHHEKSSSIRDGVIGIFCDEAKRRGVELVQSSAFCEVGTDKRWTNYKVRLKPIIREKQTIEDYEEHSVRGPEAYMEQYYTKKQLEALAKEAQDLDMGYGKDDK